MNKVVAIIQARMGSTRFPGKVLVEISSRPLIFYVVERVRRAHLVDQVVVATSVNPADDAIVEYCNRNGIECFRGSENDVLDRFYQAAKRYGAEVVVRICGDCPLVDPGVIDRVITRYLDDGYDYASNTLRYTYPDGLDVEVFSFRALEAAWRDAKLPSEREHVTPYLRSSNRFRIVNVESEIDLSTRNYRWTVDEPADLEFVRIIYQKLGSQLFGEQQVLNLLQQEPHLMDINQEIIRNEGFYKSLTAEQAIPPIKRELKRSLELKAKAQRLIPGCSQTFSKGPTQFVQGVAPVFLSRGQGSHVWDVDGNEYVDYPLALGPIILGHNYKAVTDAVLRQIKDGTVFSLPHPLEVEVAELLVDTIPCAEMVRFAKNGSDATSGAVRIARAYTGRDVIASAGYHGWQDWYIGTTTRARGVPRSGKELTVTFEYNNIESLKRVFDENSAKVAAVIMEPMGDIEPREGFLQEVQALTRREGALLIFDEIVTGFRLALGGAQEYFRVTPDLACFGKAMANGYPLAAIVGRSDVMALFDEVFFSFTFGGEALSLAAAKATVNEMREKNVVAYLWEQGRRLRDGYNVLAREYGIEEYTKCLGLPPRTIVSFKDETEEKSLVLKSLFQQECLKRGILFSGVQHIAYTHSIADIDYTLRVYRTALEILANAIRSKDARQRLEGEPVQSVFRQP